MSSFLPSEPQSNGKYIDNTNRTDVRVFTHAPEDVAPASAPEDLPICWICLDSGTAAQPLIQPCNCPRQAHPACVARWQLQSAGTRKETHCEFCDAQLPDWKRTLTPQCGANAPAIMNVNFNDRTFSFEVKPGADGYKEFTAAIRKAFDLPPDSELNITFTCDEPVATAPENPFSDLAGPSTPPQIMPPPPPVIPRVETVALPPSPTAASLLTLQGAGAYDAAVHCASVSAARRIAQSGSPSSPPPTHPGMVPPFLNQPYHLAGSNLRQLSPVDPRARQFPGHLRPRTPGLPTFDEARPPQRRNGGSNMLQRASKAVRKFTGRKSDKE